MSQLQPGAPSPGALAAYVENLWGTKTRLVPQQVVPVAVTPTRLCNNNPRRLGLIVINRGSGQVDVDWNPSIVLGSGVPLAALGGTMTLSAFEDGELVGYDLYAIAAAAGNSVSVYEIEGT